MSSKTAKLLMVKVNISKKRGFTFPVPIWVVDEFFLALKDLALVGEIALKHVKWVKQISPREIISVAHNVIKDLRQCRGLEVVDVKFGDVHVKVSLR